MDKGLRENYEYSISYISPRIRMILEKLNDNTVSDIQEIRLRTNRPVVIVTASGSSFLTTNGRTSFILSAGCVLASENEISDTVNKICGYSMHSHSEDILNGYVTLPNGSRVGLCGTAVFERGELKSVKDISSINIRIPRTVESMSEIIMDKVFSIGLCNLIIAGPPSSGKTTMLKDIAYQLSSGRLGRYYKLCVVDERKELYSEKSDALALGPNTDVISGFPKGTGIGMAVRTLSPEVIICDEIGGGKEVEEIVEGMNSGVKFILSLHADSVSELKLKKQFIRLCRTGGFKKIILMSGSDAPGTVKSIINYDEVMNENTAHSLNFISERGSSDNFCKAN